MPKQRQTCTRCSMRRQKCDRKSPCTRCVQNKEAHLCTTEWKDGYNPTVHRKYPRKTSPAHNSVGVISDGISLDGGQWPLSTTSPGLPLHLRTQPDGSINHQVRNRSFSATSSSEGTHNRSQLPTPNSTNIDFITYGRSEFADISMGTLLREKDEYARNQALMEQSLSQSRTKTCLDESTTSVLSPAAQSVEVHHLQSLLPPREIVLQIVDYHERCMSYWCGGIYHGPSFRKALIEAYGDAEQLDLRNHDWRWSALLFSILSASMIGSPEAVSASWGFSDAEKLRMAKQWGNAQISSLVLGDFASRHHIYSVQAILNMHTSEHLVGSTKEWAAYQSACTVIARGLGLHKLGPHPDDAKSPLDMTPEQKEALIQREIGRRVWSALTSQDWLCSTSQGMYTLQKRHYTSILPKHFDEETMTVIQDDDHPTYTHISNYLNEIASMLVRYLDDMFDAPDLSSKYNVVLRYDAIMRAMSIEKIPKFMSPRTPYNPAWPQWARWARRSYLASASHKVIMVHQSFLGRSFKDPRYTYSRWACLSSAKIIIEAMDTRHPEEPQWWVEQAFVVTAGLCLGLDLFHRTQRDAEAVEHQSYVERAIRTLEQWPTSSVAAHGIRLLTSLLQEHTKKFDGSRSDSRGSNPSFPHNIAPQALADAASESTPAPAAETTDEEPVITNEAWTTNDFDVDMMGFEDLMDNLPMQAGLDNNLFFESMLSFTNTPFV